jgi:hypothetical protein
MDKRDGKDKRGRNRRLPARRPANAILDRAPSRNAIQKSVIRDVVWRGAKRQHGHHRLNACSDRGRHNDGNNRGYRVPSLGPAAVACPPGTV